MRKFLSLFLLLGFLPVLPASAEAGLNQCLTPGRCQAAEWRKSIFPLFFRPLSGCSPERPVVRRAAGYGRRVALTFDDGPSLFTPLVLRSLKRYKAPATFFVVGSMISGREAMLRKALREGSILANHSWSHPRMPALTEEMQRLELHKTNLAIRRASGYRPCLFRPPYGLTDQELESVSRGSKLQTVLWDVDGADWESPAPELLAQRVLSTVKPGSIILLHDGGGDRSATAAALPAILRGLKQKRLRPVTLPRLLGLPERR